MNLTERGGKNTPSCAKYWPDNTSVECGKIKVTFKGIESHPDYVIRTFAVNRNKHSELRVVRQFQFTAWPVNRAVPVHPTSFVDFVKKVASFRVNDRHPLVSTATLFQFCISCHIKILPKAYIIHCFTKLIKNFLPQDTLSHNHLINCSIPQHNFYQKRTPCLIVFTVKGAFVMTRRIRIGARLEKPAKSLARKRLLLFILRVFSMRHSEIFMRMCRRTFLWWSPINCPVKISLEYLFNHSLQRCSCFLITLKQIIICDQPQLNLFQRNDWEAYKL